MNLARIGIISSKSSLDSNARAFLNAAGITDPTIKAAINNLVIAYKTSGLWEIMDCIYPLKGGSGNSQKLNLKDARNSNDAFRIQFEGEFTFYDYGLRGNTSDTYGLNFYQDSGSGNYSSRHIYIDTRVQTASVSLLYYSTPDDQYVSSGDTFIAMSGYTSGFNGRLSGMISDYSNASNRKVMHNLSIIDSTSSKSGATTTNYTLFAQSANYRASDAIVKFMAFGKGLSDAEALLHQQIVVDFLTSLGMQNV